MPHAIVPEQLHKIAPTSTEAEDLACVRVTAEALLHLESQRIHAAPHVRDTTGDPDAHARRKGDHARSKTWMSRPNASGSMLVGTARRRPFTSVTSTVSLAALVEDVTIAAPGCSGAIDTGENGTGGPPSSRPSRCSFRHRVSSEREMPYRRAVAEPCR